MSDNEILSPVMLWRDFEIKRPLQESKTSEEVFDNVIYSDVYFSGRETAGGRVRVFGVYAKSRVVKATVKSAALLVIPDASETVDLEIVNRYVRQGYSVLMIDYRGEAIGVDNYTRYPECISYANYFRRGTKMDRCDESARETCWFEWTSVARYALDYLKTRRGIESVGVIGIKSGADVGWQLCSMCGESVKCFVPLFNAGGRAFCGYFKNGEEDMPMGDERLRYLAGVDASAYMQYMRVPTLYLAPTNSLYSDVERGLDALSRFPKETPLYVNFSPRMCDVLDERSLRDVDLFLAKHLLGFGVDFPAEPKITMNVDGRSVVVAVEESDYAEAKVKKVSVYLAEGGEDPLFRNWLELKPSEFSEGVQKFSYLIQKTCSFISAFAVVTYRNGFTLSSKIALRKFPKIRFPKSNLIYSNRYALVGTSAYTLAEKADCRLFFTGEYPVSMSVCAGGISGVKTNGGLIFYRFDSELYKIGEFALLKADVFAREKGLLKIALITGDGGAIKEYAATATVRQGGVWNNILIKFSDFKSAENRSVENYSLVKAIRFESEFDYALNNVLVI